MTKSAQLLVAASTLAAIVHGSQALAEEPVRLAAASSDIIVTGLKDDEGQAKVADSGALGAKSLLDTPFSMTVVDAEEISKRQATTIAQIFINDPSVFSYASAGTTNWWGTQIRGLGVRNYYIDDVQLMLYWGGDFPLESIESVTALKGLTGFMYGFGAPGGLISYKTKRPTEQPLLTTEIGWRGQTAVNGHVDAGGPLTQDGRLGYRINIAGEKGTAYNDAGINRLFGSLALEYAVTPDLDWYATASLEESKLKREPFHIYWDMYEDAALPKVTYDYDKVNIRNSFYKSRTLATATGLDWRFADGWSAKVTYGYNSKRHYANKMFVYMLDQSGDYEGNAYNFGWLDKTHFAQAMLQGEFETGPVRHAIVGGASYILTKAYRSTQFDWDEGAFQGNIYQNQDFLVTKDISFALADGPDREQQRALFLSDTLYVGDHLQAIVGGRYTRYKATPGLGQERYKTSAFTPTFALIVKPAPYATIYGSYVESLEPGSRVGGEYANFGELLKATISKQYEVGVKYEHQGLSLTAAAFRIERANTMDQFIDGARYLTQDGLSLYKGIEATASYRVSEDLRLGLGAIYLDPRLSKLSPDEDGNPSPLEGNIPAEASKWQVTSDFDYYVSAVPGLSLHGNVRYFGKGPLSDFNTLYIPDRVIASAGFQYETKIGGQKVAFTGNLNNLFNKKYWSYQVFGEGINGSLSVKLFW
jgi:iron complex outermembrane receptor protein